MENELMTKWEHEHDMARLEIANKRLWILVLIIFAALVITNGAWFYYERQQEVVEETTTNEYVTKTIISNNKWNVFKHLDLDFDLEGIVE